MGLGVTHIINEIRAPFSPQAGDQSSLIYYFFWQTMIWMHVITIICLCS